MRILPGNRILPLLSLAALGLVLQPQVEPASPWRPAPRWTADPALFASGDLLFRRGRSLVSQVVLAAEGVGEYSHVGLVVVSAGRVWVIHALPPEEPDREGGVVVEAFQEYLAPDHASAWALYRPRDGQAAASVVEMAWDWARHRVPFDEGFDLSSPDKLYCTELVWRAYRAAGVDLESGVPGSRGRYLLPDRLAKSPQLTRIQVFREEASGS